MIALVILCGLVSLALGQVPDHFSYQGMLTDANGPFTGSAQFRFALVDTVSNTYFWSNDGTAGAPVAPVAVPVTSGVFSVLLGAPPMAPLTAVDIAGFSANQALRVWVDLGTGEVPLGDLPLSSTLFAKAANYAWESPDGFSAAGQVWSKSGGFKFPDGTVQTTAAGGGGGITTLDMAYDAGGSGAGRSIIADSGAVQILGNNWDVTNTYGALMIGDLTYNLRVGVATGGGGAGIARLRATGGLAQLILGSGSYDVAKVDTGGFHVSRGPFQVADNGQTRVVGDFGIGQGGAAVRAENTNAGGIALWTKAQGSDAAVVVEQNGTGDMARGFKSGVLKFRVLNSGEVVTPAVTITGGADLAEPFPLSEVLGEVAPGSVLVIDPENPGSLMLSDQPYDARVAGVISGAGGVNPGLTLRQLGTLEEGRHVALSGRVYVRVNDTNGPIRPGDMITTSTKPGVGMRATDRDRSYGAVVGKAMTALDEGEGLVLVLVGLQ